jgi:hypothetical protein
MGLQGTADETGFGQSSVPRASQSPNHSASKCLNLHVRRRISLIPVFGTVLTLEARPSLASAGSGRCDSLDELSWRSVAEKRKSTVTLGGKVSRRNLKRTARSTWMLPRPRLAGAESVHLLAAQVRKRDSANLLRCIERCESRQNLLNSLAALVLVFCQVRLKAVGLVSELKP